MHLWLSASILCIMYNYALLSPKVRRKRSKKGAFYKQAPKGCRTGRVEGWETPDGRLRCWCFWVGRSYFPENIKTPNSGTFWGRILGFSGSILVSSSTDANMYNSHTRLDWVKGKMCKSGFVFHDWWCPFITQSKREWQRKGSRLKSG